MCERMQKRAKLTHKVRLTKEKETLLITLYGKAADYRSKTSLLNDRKAYEILGMLDYDFGKVSGDDEGIMTAVRAKEFDVWLESFLQRNKNAVVLQLGCGLDTRVTRIKRPVGVMWFDLDYPKVISLRKKFYADSARYKMIGSSITDPKWLKKIPADKPTIIIAEGVFEYLTGGQVKALLNRLTARFRTGEIAFDVMSSFAVKFGKKELREQTGAVHKWGVDKLSSVDRLDRRLRRLESLSLFESRYISRLPSKYRLMYKNMYKNPSFKNALRLLLYEF